MELKDFIKETISQISQGVIESQNELKEVGVVINPRFTVKTENRQFLATQKDSMGRSEITNISFDVAIEINETKTGKSGIGVAQIVHAGISKGTEDKTFKMNRISFSVSVILPFGNPLQQTPRSGGITIHN